MAIHTTGLPGLVVSTIRHTVSHVRRPGSPSKIVDAVVGGIIVSVAGFHAIWAQPDERIQDQLMDHARTLFTIRADDAHLHVPTLLAGRREHPPVDRLGVPTFRHHAVKAPNSAMT